ncbi:hypothetical protein [Candidatus Sororendozoicomonas aggregata]|uniref:hypothetical protein n=1 Tax=Candidatus Sororendozoicomonas aggregata TaxID=3073239 RepID=UPI002ED20FBB
MGIKSILRAGKFMATKPVVFITGLLTLTIMANAYSLDDYLYIEDLIPPGNPHYSKNGYALKPIGHGYCMYGVYNPASCTTKYETEVKYVTVHYASSIKHGCAFRHSSQDFNIINNDTGKIVTTLQWYIFGGDPYLKGLKRSKNIIADVTGKYPDYWVKNKLNIFCYKN